MKEFFKTTFACVLAMVVAGIILLFVGIGFVAGILTSSDDKGEIGNGVHTRYIIDAEKFMNKLNK